MLLLLLSHFSRVRLRVTPQTAAHQAPHPWDSLGKNTGVGCHFLLQCVKVKSESEVAQLRLLATPQTAAYQAPPSMGFSRQEYWSGVPLPLRCLYIPEWNCQSIQSMCILNLTTCCQIILQSGLILLPSHQQHMKVSIAFHTPLTPDVINPWLFDLLAHIRLEGESKIGNASRGADNIL